ncbi:hypothetical protein F7725_013280 [Dissostichus mawsoni]|uniref:Uncharacterized protein n=1 Tax=Dissostichus mawsoni TaxID=36200 RepID=A0A7J5YTJ5_DISMA|nr:hypothetical protein F7725_013280 [Dissostichus mawsoni]
MLGYAEAQSLISLSQAVDGESTLSSLSVVPPSSSTAPCPPCLWSLLRLPPAPCPPCLWSPSSPPAPVVPVCGPSFVFHQHPVLPVCGPPSSSTSTLSSLSVVPPSSSTSTLSSLSVVPTSTVSPPSTSTQSSQQSTSVDDCVGPDNIEGYGAVQELAEFLTPTGLKWRRVRQNNHSVAGTGGFRQKEDQLSTRHKNTLKQGRFRATKKIVAPGASLGLTVLHSGQTATEWWRPSSQGSVASTKTLCAARERVSRFTMVIRAYKHIRECVITNAKVMTETTIQLPEVNVATVTQWFSRRCRSQEQQILKQGIPAPDAPMAGPEQLLVAMQKGTSLFLAVWLSLTPLFCHQTLLVRQSSRRDHNQWPSHRSHHHLHTMLFPSLHRLHPSQHHTWYHLAWTLTGCAWKLSDDASQHAIGISYSGLTSSQSNVPYTTQQYRKRKEEREQSGSGKRKYVKKTDAIICKNCNKDRKPPAHLQYFGNWYCKESETQSMRTGGLCWSKEGMGKKERGAP